jgi:cytosine/uracil/thiamine/allantoin permease
VLVFGYVFVRRMQIDVIALYEPKGRYRYWVGFTQLAGRRSASEDRP